MMALRLGIITALLAPLAQADWLHHAGNEARTSTAAVGPSDLDVLLWTGRGPGGQTITCEGPSSPAVWGDRVYVNARHFSGATHVNNKLVAFDRINGAFLFERIIKKGVLDSWCSPAVDVAAGTVLLASGNELYAVDAIDGHVAWSRVLDHNVVTSSPLVVQLGFRRVFIADYDPFGGTGSLYCINASPFDVMGNPYQPGDLVWQEPIGATSGPSPAYADGLVFVASAADSGGFPGTGRIRALDPSAAPGSRLLWTFTGGDGFFGGVCVVNGFVYAASYDFNGSGDNSALFKLNAADGLLQWSVPCERTNSIPVVAGERIYVAAGINGFGSAIKLQAFRDDGASAVKLWDTHVDTGGALGVGGWTHQPVRVLDHLYAGKIATVGGTSAPATELFMLDLTRVPGDAAFVADSRTGVGGSPAVSGGRAYTIGAAGLQALAAAGDYDGDGRATGADIQAFLVTLASPSPLPTDRALGDLDASGTLDGVDASLLVNRLLGL